MWTSNVLVLKQATPELFYVLENITLWTVPLKMNISKQPLTIMISLTGWGRTSSPADTSVMVNLPAIILEELTGVELAAIPPGVAPLPWSLTMGSDGRRKKKSQNEQKWKQKGKKNANRWIDQCQWETCPTEVGMIHGLPGCEASLMVVAQQFVQEVQRFCANQVLVLAVHKPFPSFARVSAGTGANQ